MRIILLIEEKLADDAAVVLETIGFVHDESQPAEEPHEGLVKVVGEFPEKDLAELSAVAGVRDWRVEPLEESADRSWPWSQMPETD